jgi:hypothetical protein
MLGVGIVDLLAIQKRFDNLAALWHDQTIQVVTYEDSVRQEAFMAVGRLQKLLKAQAVQVPNLETLLTYIHWDLRGYLATADASANFWAQRIEDFDYQLASAAHALDNDTKSVAIFLKEKLLLLSHADSKGVAALFSNLSAERTLIVTEKDRQRGPLSGLMDQQSSEQSVDIVQLQTFFRLDTENYDQILILAAPRRLSDNYMRALLLGGVTSKAKFLCSSWLAGYEPQKVEQDLVPGLPGVKKPVFQVMGPTLSENYAELADGVFESLQDDPQSVEYETYSGGGSVDCRVIKLAKGHIMPVELQAKKVSILTVDQDGDLVVQYRTPGKNLESGDILFELRDGAEEDFLMDQAQVAMGIAFHEFSKGRAEWKRRVIELIAFEGKPAVIRKLKSAGVKTAQHLDDWLENVDFTTPRAKKDWHNLLLALEFTPSEISRLEVLGSELRATLISVGQKARGYMADVVDSGDLERVRNSEIVTKQLDGFGDAVFILATVQDPDAGVSTCQPHELRKVLRA